MPAPAHLDPRLLRAFVAVAEELHFTRAAARLYVAQQALSRDVRRLERELGAELFVRTTRQVTPTADGERLLPYARRVLQAQDDLLAAFGQARPLLVDLNSPGLATGRLVLERARSLAPEQELMARYESGLTHAAGELVAGRLDASFGRFAGLPAALRAGLGHQPVRHEPMAVVLPEDHPLARLERVPLSALAGETVYAGAGNPRTPEWTDLAHRLFEGRGIHVASPVPLAVARRSSGASWTRHAIPSSPWRAFRPCPRPWCARSSTPCRSRRCRSSGERDWCIPRSTRCAGQPCRSRPKTVGWRLPVRDGFRPPTPL